MLNESNTQYALKNLTRALEKGNSQNLQFSAFEEDLIEVYRFSEDNGVLSETSQILISFLAHSSSNYQVLALLRNSLKIETNQFISFYVYSGLTQMIAESVSS